MYSALSNLSACSVSLSSPHRSNDSMAPFQGFIRPPPLRRPVGGRHCGLKAIRAEVGRSSLDHLQRANKEQLPPPQAPKTRLAAQPAPTGLWGRFPTARTVQQMMETMERIMEDPLAYRPSGEEDMGSYRRGRTPWEIKEGEGEYKLRFDMPGMTRRDVKMWVEEKMLVIDAEKLPKKAKEGEEPPAAEEWPASSYGRYKSRIALPDNIVLEKIKAEVKDGVLYITIPKAPASAKVLDIEVQ